MNTSENFRMQVIVLAMAIALTSVSGCLHSRADRQISPTPFITDFWRNMGWQRYEALASFLGPNEQKPLRAWLGPGKKPGIRVTQSSFEELQMVSPVTAEVAVTVTYFIEPEYVEHVTEVTQTWTRKDGRWMLTGGFPLDDTLKP